MLRIIYNSTAVRLSENHAYPMNRSSVKNFRFLLSVKASTRVMFMNATVK